MINNSIILSIWLKWIKIERFNADKRLLRTDCGRATVSYYIITHIRFWFITSLCYQSHLPMMVVTVYRLVGACLELSFQISLTLALIIVTLPSVTGSPVVAVGWCSWCAQCSQWEWQCGVKVTAGSDQCGPARTPPARLEYVDRRGLVMELSQEEGDTSTWGQDGEW